MNELDLNHILLEMKTKADITQTSTYNAALLATMYHESD